MLPAASCAHRWGREPRVDPWCHRPVGMKPKYAVNMSQKYPAVRGAVEANGIRFSTLEWGEGPLVLCFHGFPDTAETWDVVGPGIAAAGYRVVAPFMRGYAPTAIPAADTDSRTLGNDVLALIAALGGHPARVIGHDWGAEAVYAAAGLDPTAIERLVAIAIPHRVGVRPTPSILWALRHFLSLTLPGAEARFAANNYYAIEMFWRRWSPTWQYSEADLSVARAAFAQPGVVHAALGYYRQARVLAPAFLRAKITVPTLCIAGGDDPGVAPGVFVACGSQFGGPYAVTTVAGGHFCHRESPQAVIDAIVPFLRG